METISFQEAKTAFISLYGDGTFNPEFSDFDVAFMAAWESFDFVAGAKTPEEFAEGMCECWQLQD
jgi:hypothetical protein